MKRKIVNRQQNSKLCLVCGLKNDLGLKAAFYETDDNEVIAVFTPLEEHQSYPGRLHGGIAGAILDETIGRAIMCQEGTVWGVTVELTVKYKKPIPLDQELKVTGRITKNSKRLFEGTGEVILADGEVAATAWGKYMKMPIDKIAVFDPDEQEWRVDPESMPDEIEI